MGTILKKEIKDINKLSSEEREEFILQYTPLIKYIAQRMIYRLPPNIELNDLINFGIIGLLDAIEKFDPSKNIKFKTYAEFRIRGAILDALRALDWAPRSLRLKSNRLEEAYRVLEKRLGRPPDEDELAKELRIDNEELQRLLVKINNTTLLNFNEMIPENFNKGNKGFLDFFIDPNGNNPLDSVCIKETKSALEKAIKSLSEKLRLVLTLYYYEELTMKEIAEILEVTESRVSQLHSQALFTLKGKLKKTISKGEYI
ncbi:MAG: FliA/WhiG family RNA polymerase sigma factor [Thermodesulfobacteriota bacterium]|nr:FliA/WhiG family RNA polymerase sigma factor [Thermodesulfobacteriota bacterium]